MSARSPSLSATSRAARCWPRSRRRPRRPRPRRRPPARRTSGGRCRKRPARSAGSRREPTASRPRPREAETDLTIAGSAASHWSAVASDPPRRSSPSASPSTSASSARSRTRWPRPWRRSPRSRARSPATKRPDLAPAAAPRRSARYRRRRPPAGRGDHAAAARSGRGRRGTERRTPPPAGGGVAMAAGLGVAQPLEPGPQLLVADGDVPIEHERAGGQLHDRGGDAGEAPGVVDAVRLTRRTRSPSCRRRSSTRRPSPRTPSRRDGTVRGRALGPWARTRGSRTGHFTPVPASRPPATGSCTWDERGASRRLAGRCQSQSLPWRW